MPARRTKKNAGLKLRARWLLWGEWARWGEWAKDGNGGINARPPDETVVGRADGTPAMIWQHTEQEKKWRY